MINTNKILRRLIVVILFVMVAVFNIGSCNNNDNGQDSVEPTPAPTPQPTPSPAPTLPPTPQPTLPPTQPPTAMPPARPDLPVPAPAFLQENAAIAIARVCSSVIEEGSDNDPGGVLLATYKEAYEKIMMLNLPPGFSDKALAVGIIRRALIVAVGIDPNVQQRARELADICEDDIDNL